MALLSSGDGPQVHLKNCNLNTFVRFVVAQIASHCYINQYMVRCKTVDPLAPVYGALVDHYQTDRVPTRAKSWPVVDFGGRARAWSPDFAVGHT